MRYKDNVSNRLEQLTNMCTRMEIQCTTGRATRDEYLTSIQILKNAISEIKDIISVESDELEQQFAPRQ
jgi:hypothetical protein